jgi:hypothetical protein
LNRSFYNERAFEPQILSPVKACEGKQDRNQERLRDKI